MLAFVFGTGSKVMESIRTQLQQEPYVRLVEALDEEAAT
jgi:hypothetical protein